MYPTTFTGLVNWTKESQTDIHTAFSVISSPEQDERFKALMKKCKGVPFFECEGEYFKGTKTHVFIQFILDEPTGADFFVWCQKNLQRYAPAK